MLLSRVITWCADLMEGDTACLALSEGKTRWRVRSGSVSCVLWYLCFGNASMLTTDPEGVRLKAVWIRLEIVCSTPSGECLPKAAGISCFASVVWLRHTCSDSENKMVRVEIRPSLGLNEQQCIYGCQMVMGERSRVLIFESNSWQECNYACSSVYPTAHKSKDPNLSCVFLTVNIYDKQALPTSRCT